MPEIARLLVSSKLINKVAKCAAIIETLPHLGQIYIFRFEGKIMLGAMNGFAFGMRIAEYDETLLIGNELIEAEQQQELARKEIGADTWMFPADLKIPNGMNAMITLYNDKSTIIKTKNAVYGPFEQVLTLGGTEFNVDRIFSYPDHLEGSSRAVNPKLLAKLIAAICEKDDVLIMNISGVYDKPIHFRTTEGTAYGLLMPISDPGLADAAATDAAIDKASRIAANMVNDLRANGFDVEISSEIHSNDDEDMDE